MKLNKLSVIAAIGLLACAASAQAADENLYAELGYTNTKYSGVGSEWTPSALRGVFGTSLHENYAVEAMLLGLADSSKVGVTVGLGYKF